MTMICIEDNTELGLKLFTYDSCSHSDTDEIKINRSVIKDNDRNVVCYSLPFTTEIENFEEDVDFNVEDYVLYPSLEGSLLRVFYYNDRWMISTNRRMDAFTSHWSCKLSFGQLFMEHLSRIYPNQLPEYFFSKLGKENVYFFLIQSNQENRIVCNIEFPLMYYIGKYINGSPLIVDTLPFDEDESIPRVAPITANIDSFETMKAYIMDMINPMEEQGILMFHRHKNQQIKVYHPEYKRLWKVRNNVPSLQQRYLELRTQSQCDLDTFFMLYPKFRAVADRLEENILHMSKFIYNAYVSRFIKKQYISIPKELYYVMRLAHSWHIQDRNANKIYYQKIVSFVNQQEPKLMTSMIRSYLKNQSIKN
jgi:hypothetical protein